jgi:hypothetical protein
MKRSMRAFGAVVFSIGAWLAAPIAAQEQVTEQPALEATAPPAAGEPRVFAELLFVMPTLDDTTFVIRAPTSGAAPSGQRENADFDYEPAFRLGAGYEFASGRAVELSYTNLEANSSETVTGDFLWATRGSPVWAGTFDEFPGVASADIDADYQRIDAHLNQPWPIAGFDDLGLGLVLGFEWADFRVGEHYLYDNQSGGVGIGQVSTASRSWGIGPEIGLDLGYGICHACGIPGALSLSGAASIGVLFSETHTRASITEFGAPRFSARDDDTSRLLPVIHARMGLAYAVPVAERVEARFELGYQLDSYLRGLARSSFVDDTAQGLSTTDYYDFDLQGVYLSFGAAF